MPSPPPGQQRHYNPVSLDKWFTISCVLFLVSLIWMFLQDYNREWRPYQKAFRVLDADKTRETRRAELEAIEDSNEYQQAQAQFSEAEQELKGKATQLNEAQAELERLSREYNKALQVFNFKKAEIAAAKYKFEMAETHGDASAGKARRRMEKLQAEVVELQLESEALETAIAEQNRVIRELTSTRREVERTLSTLTRRVSLLDRRMKALDPQEMTMANRIGNFVRDLPLLDMMNPYYNVRDRQLIVDGITDDVVFSRVQKVDRCMVCHLGAMKPEFADEAHPFRAHPRLDLFLAEFSPHPLKEFGCTSCHRGRGRGTSFGSTAHMPGSAEQKAEWEEKYDWHQLHHWDHPMHPVKYAQAGCFQCHSGQTIIPGADTLNLGLALVERTGCYGCHAIEPFKDKPKPGPGLQHIAAKTDEDWAFRWINSPHDFRKNTWMPSFFNESNSAHIRDRTDQEVKAMVRYLFAKSEAYEMESPPEGDAARGEELVKSVGCLACHHIDPDRERPEQITLATLRSENGPALTGLGAKTSVKWVYNWLREPSRYHPGTRMANPRLTDQEAADIAIYLCESEIDQSPDFMSQPVPDTDDAKLREITLDYLSSIMTQKQARRAIEAMTQDEMMVNVGQRLIRHYGCFGCHDIPGFESDTPIGTDLTEEGSKPVVKLDFGYLHEEIEHASFAWFDAKLRDPRIFDRGTTATKPVRDYLKMPNFRFTQQQSDALVTVLLGLTKKDPELRKLKPRTTENFFIEAGESVVRHYNCRGCHEMQHGGGDIRESITEWYRAFQASTTSDEEEEEDEWGEDEEEDEWGEDDAAEEDDAEFLAQVKSYSPPALIGEGRKVQPEWLFHFIEDPVPIRPWLKVRMPTFDLTDARRNALVGYFSYLDGEMFPFETQLKPETEGEVHEAGKRLFSEDVFQCQRCHIKGTEPPAGTPDMWAPNLQAVAERLKPGWIIDWLRDPQQIIPGTKMPGYFPDGTTSQPDLDADPEAQMAALRDYMLTLGSDSK